jgi:hypothetical protein
LAEALDFNAQVVEAATRGAVDVWPVSARQALRAREARDAAGLRSSGLPAFERAFRDYLTADSARDLHTSLRLHARRLATSARDAASLTLHAADLADEDLTARAKQFQARFAEVNQLARESEGLLASEVSRLVAETSESAAAATRPAVDAVAVALDRAEAQLGDVPAAEAERALREVSNAHARRQAETWRGQRAAELDEAIATLGRRLAGRLDEQVRAVRRAATDLFDVALVEPGPTAALVCPRDFRYDFGEGTGVTDLYLAALRGRMPGRLGRQRAARHVRAELPKLVDRQFGRARADFQDRLEQTGRQLLAELRGQYDVGAGRIAAAVQCSTALRKAQAADRDRARTALGKRVTDLREILVTLTAPCPPD